MQVVAVWCFVWGVDGGGVGGGGGRRVGGRALETGGGGEASQGLVTVWCTGGVLGVGDGWVVDAHTQHHRAVHTPCKRWKPATEMSTPDKLNVSKLSAGHLTACKHKYVSGAQG